MKTESPHTWVINTPRYDSDILYPEHKISPWVGHRNFGYDLITYLKPATVVELGTHYGTSFFSFCQAAKDNNLNCALFSVDTWVGDKHAGEYDESVYELVTKTVKTYFPEQNITLLRKLFSEALEDFDDNSIDVIHIDGYHTYEAVSNDFNTWLPKLKPEGIILFHDTSQETGYGSHAFWTEITKKYQHWFEFSHSWGLGVLFPKGDTIYQKLLHENMHDKIKYYEAQGRYEYSNEQLAHAKETIAEQNETIAEQNNRLEVYENSRLFKIISFVYRLKKKLTPKRKK